MLIGFQLCAPLGSAILIGHFIHTFKSRFISWGVTLFARVKGHAFSSSVIGYFFVVPLTRIVPVFFFSVPKIVSGLPIPGKISRFPEEFCISPETDLVRVVTPG